MGLVLRVVKRSCTLALACFHLIRFRLHLHFFTFSPISSFGLAMTCLAFLSSYFFKSTYTNVYQWIRNLPPPWSLVTLASCSHPIILNDGSVKTTEMAYLANFCLYQKFQKTGSLLLWHFPIRALILVVLTLCLEQLYCCTFACYSSLCTLVHGQTCGWLTLDKPLGDLRVPLFWPMRAKQYNLHESYRPITP